MDDLPLRGTCGEGYSPVMWWGFLLSDLAFFLAYTVLSFLFAFMIRVRHHPSIHYLFWFLGGFVFLCGLTHLCSVLLLFWPTYTLALWMNMAGALVSVAAAIGTAIVTPTILKVPPVRGINEKLDVVWLMVRDLHNRISVLAQTDPKSADEIARALSDSVKEIQDAGSTDA